MDQRADFITVATQDLDAARRFYVDALGWSPILDVPGEILFFQVNHGTVLGLFDAVKFVEDLGEHGGGPVGVSGLTLSHNVDNERAVDEVVATALAAGAALLKPPQRADFGGYHGHFADPNGVIWEICFNPGWTVDASGTVSIR